MVTTRRGGLAVVVHLGLLACMPPPLDETGKRCNAERSCGEDFVCVAERCQWADGGLGEDDAGVDGGRDAGFDAGADAGRDAGAGDDGGLDGGSDGGPDAGAVIPTGRNLLANPGFELEFADGGIRFWRQGNGTAQPSRPAKSGAQALRLTGQPNNGPFVTSEFIRGSTSFPMLFCARVCARNEFDAGYSVTITIRERLFDGGTNSSSGQSTGSIRDGGWVVVTEEYGAIGGEGIELRLSSDVRADASVLVDDAELFRAPGSQCVFP
ncbi:MAG: hypothetical protein SFW67_04520 [Myxococcaceae bacterium]|nr:hypothetical protein [Myxococcaceae bacterium]